MTTEPDVGPGPRLLAIEMALRALIATVSDDDPALRERIEGMVEAYLGGIAPESELERAFIARARHFVEALVRPPAV